MQPQTAPVETAPQNTPPVDDKKRVVKFTIANLVDRTADDTAILDMNFHYGNPPKTYRVIFGGHINEAPKEVVDFLKTRAYDKYKIHKNEDTGEVYPVKIGVSNRFMVSEVG